MVCKVLPFLNVFIQLKLTHFFLSPLVFVLSRPCIQNDCGVSCLTKDFILSDAACSANCSHAYLLGFKTLECFTVEPALVREVETIKDEGVKTATGSVTHINRHSHLQHVAS